MFTSTLLQATFAELVTSGDLDRHLRRVRRIYRQRRDHLVTVLRRHVPAATPTGIAAGLQTLLVLPPGADEQAVATRALAAGVRVSTLTEFRVHPRHVRPAALVLGYGHLRPDVAELGARLLGEAVRGG